MFPYGKLRLKPERSNPIEEVLVDPELGGEGFTYRLADDSEDTIHLDAVLEYNEDPEYLRELLLHGLTIEAKESSRMRISRDGRSYAASVRQPANSTAFSMRRTTASRSVSFSTCSMSSDARWMCKCGQSVGS